MRGFLTEIKHMLRLFLRNPGSAIVSMITLAAGLGLTMFMFGAIDAYILRPLPVPESERLVHLEYSNPEQGRESLEVPLHDYLDWRSQIRSVESLAAFYRGTVNLSGTERPERFDGAFVSSNVLSVIRVKPYLGRWFLPGEDAPGAQPVVIIGFDLWRNRYQSDRNIIGKSIRVNARDSIVVGVMPPDFKFPMNESVWVPMSIEVGDLKRGQGNSLEVFGRLAANTSIETAAAELRAISMNLQKAYPDANAGLVGIIKPYAFEFVSREARSVIYTMFVAVVLVLLIACANSANLTVVRVIARMREFAIRSALGASRAQLIFQILTECLLISITGGLIGYFFAQKAGTLTMAALRSNPDMTPPYWVDFQTDWRTVFFAITASFVAGILAGLLPALRATRKDLIGSLHQGGYAVSQPLGRTSRILITCQIALSCVLLISAGLMARSVMKIGDVTIGANIENVLTARLGLFESQYPDAESRVLFFENLVDRLSALPGTEGATVSTSLPASFVGQNFVTIDTNQSTQPNRQPLSNQVTIAPNYFSLFDIPILKGRTFDSRDQRNTQPVAIVSGMFAEKYWPGEDAIGHRIRMGRADENLPWLTVVGVVSNVQQDEVNDELAPTVYLPLKQSEPQFMSIALRTKTDPMSYADQLSKTVQELNPDLPVYWLRPLTEWINIGRFSTLFIATLFGAFAIAALLIASVGQYAVLAFTVGNRTKEIGVRRALGALDSEVLSWLLGQGLRQFTVALVIGLPLALGFSSLLSSQLFGVKVFDPFTLIGVPLILFVVALVASIVPARRALRIHPAIALKSE